jgi:hypothetical protein
MVFPEQEEEIYYKDIEKVRHLFSNPNYNIG